MSLKLPPDVIESAAVCQHCFTKFNEIDEHQTIVDKLQNDLFQLYNGLISIEPTTDIKQEGFNDTNDFEEHIIEDESFKKPLTNESKDCKPRIYRCDEGQPYTVIMIDGKRNFQCHICNKMLARRPKEHIAMHSDEKNFKCDDCGALFRRSKDLNRHKLIHGERKYRFW